MLLRSVVSASKWLPNPKTKKSRISGHNVSYHLGVIPSEACVELCLSLVEGFFVLCFLSSLTSSEPRMEVLVACSSSLCSIQEMFLNKAAPYDRNNDHTENEAIHGPENLAVVIHIRRHRRQRIIYVGYTFRNAKVLVRQSKSGVIELFCHGEKKDSFESFSSNFL